MLKSETVLTVSKIVVKIRVSELVGSPANDMIAFPMKKKVCSGITSISKHVRF